MNGNPPEIWGDGSQTRDFIEISDIVKCILASAETDYTGIINVGTGKAISFKEVLENYKRNTWYRDWTNILFQKGKDYVEHFEDEIDM